MSNIHNSELPLPLIPEIVEFEWDAGNREKNRIKHKVEGIEAEQVFFNYPFFSTLDTRHSEREERHFGFGHTNESRLLTLVFVVRNRKVRIISARDMNKKERAWYRGEI
ncbi:MAG TPA: BrnT family toxin, partial [Bacteroidota bacterium]|nr:BrnT family toxin [Bacteroidota bacterium]